MLEALGSDFKGEDKDRCRGRKPAWNGLARVLD